MVRVSKSTQDFQSSDEYRNFWLFMLIHMCLNHANDCLNVSLSLTV